MTADEEDNYHVAQANTPLDEEGHFVHKNVSGRYREEIQEYERNKFDYMDVSPKMVFSVATALIPFLQNDDANRALMAVSYTHLISDYVDYSEIESTVKSIEGYAKRPSIQWPSYTATGANRTDIGLSVLGSAILAKNDERMNLVKTEVPDVMKLVTSGDGLYADGSVVQHTKHAYSGSYGNELLKGVGRIQSIIAGTSFDITDERINNV